MTAILYMAGTLMLVNGILMIGGGNMFGVALMVGGLALFLANVLRLLGRHRDDARPNSG